MRDKSSNDFVCPCCGEPVAANAAACRSCGSDERTGWSDNTYLDGIDLPDMDESGYEEMLTKEFSQKKSKSAIDWRTAVGVILLIATLLFLAIR
jgi:hypothetical protein